MSFICELSFSAQSGHAKYKYELKEYRSITNSPYITSHSAVEFSDLCLFGARSACMDAYDLIKLIAMQH